MIIGSIGDALVSSKNQGNGFAVRAVNKSSGTVRVSRSFGTLDVEICNMQKNKE